MKKYCTNCGTELAEDALFCTNCGQKFTETTLVEKTSANNQPTTDNQNNTPADQTVPTGYPQTTVTMNSNPQPAPQPFMPQPAPAAPAPQPAQAAAPSYLQGTGYPKPVTTAAFVGLEILYAIPIIGLIACIIIAASAKNDNIANHAKSKLILLLIGLVIFILIGILFVSVYKSLGITNMQDYIQQQLESGYYSNGLIIYIRSMF